MARGKPLTRMRTLSFDTPFLNQCHKKINQAMRKLVYVRVYANSVPDQPVKPYGRCQAKKSLWACAICACRSSCACAKYHPGLCSPLIYSIVFNDSVSGQWRPWSACADAQADLCLRCPICPKTRYRLARPISYDQELCFTLLYAAIL